MLDMTRKIIICALVLLCSLSTRALDVQLNPDKGIASDIPVNVMEANLTALLSEINSACESDRPLNLDGIKMSAEAKATLQDLWVVSHFHCDDDQVTDRLWNFKTTFIPNRSLEKASCQFLMTAIRKTALYMFGL